MVLDVQVVDVTTSFLELRMNIFVCARSHFHLDVLEAVYIKLHSPVLCQQKEYVKVLYLV